MILNLKSPRVQRDSFDMYSTQQETSLKYQWPVRVADKVTGKHSFHWFCCVGQIFFERVTIQPGKSSDVIIIILILGRSCLVGGTG